MAPPGFFVLRVSMIMSYAPLRDLRADRMAGISRQAVSVKMSVCRHRPAMQPLPPHGNQLPRVPQYSPHHRTDETRQVP